MKSLLILSLLLLSITACQDSSSNRHIALLNGQNGVNPNSIAIKSAENAKERVNKLELSKIDANTKIEIAKIKSNNQLKIAQVNANTTKEVAKTDSNSRIEASKIDALTKKDDIQNTLYISIAVIIVLIIGMFLLYFNNKKSRELKQKLHKEQLEHERQLREQEHHEKRLHKMLELVGEGKLSPTMEEEIICSLTKPTPSQTLIESK